MLTALTGLAAGAAHVVTGADHLAALAPIALDDRRRAVRAGAAWGLGHGAGVVALGALGLAAGEALDVTRLSAWSELAVGVLLVFVGLWALRRAGRITVHAHTHDHLDEAHGHLHVHVDERDHAAPKAHAGHTHAAFGVGMLHGAAGTGHIFGVLPALALPPGEAVVYLGAYLVAAVLSMTLVAVALGRLTQMGGPALLRGLMRGCGAAAVALGVFWVMGSWPVA
jgi:hypothetical protein